MRNVCFKKALVVGIIVLFIGMSYIPSISGNIDEPIDKENVNDYENSPQVTITKPENGMYFNNQKIFPFFVPLILCGVITIVAKVADGCGSDRVEFSINDVIQETVTGPGPEYEFSLTWVPFLKINVKVVAYTFNGTATDEITIWRIFS